MSFSNDVSDENGKLINPPDNKRTGFFGASDVNTESDKELQQDELSYESSQATQQANVLGNGSLLNINTYKQAFSDFIGGIVPAIKDYAGASSDTVDTFGNAILHPIDTYNKIEPTFLEPWMNDVNKAATGDNNFMSDRGVKKIGDMIDILQGSMDAFFSPIGGLNTVAQNTPGLKQVSDVMNLMFNGLSDSIKMPIQGAFHVIPDGLMSPDTKNILSDRIANLSSTIGVVLLGDKLLEGTHEFIKNGIPVTPEMGQQIISDSENHIMDSAKNGETNPAKMTTDSHKNIPPPVEPQASDIPKTPGQTHDVRTVMSGLSDGGYSTTQIIDIMKKLYQKNPDGDFPVTDVADEAAKVRPENPTESSAILKNVRPPIKGVKPIENPIKVTTNPEGNPDGVTNNPDGSRTTVSNNGRVSMTETNPRPVIDGEKVTKGALDINAQRIFDGFKPFTPEEMAKFNPTSNAEQDTEIAKLISDPEKTDAVISGKEPIPDRIVDSALFKRLSDYARDTNNTDLQRRLINSDLAKASSLHGQGLALSGGDEFGVAKNAKELADAREDFTDKKLKTKGAKEATVKDLSKQLDEEIKNTKPKKTNWGEFVDSITC